MQYELAATSELGPRPSNRSPTGLSRNWRIVGQSSREQPARMRGDVAGSTSVGREREIGLAFPSKPPSPHLARNAGELIKCPGVVWGYHLLQKQVGWGVILCGLSPLVS